MSVYSIDGAMGEALGHLKRISSHLRKHGQYKSANELGKLSVMIVNAFSEGIEKIPHSQYVMNMETDVGIDTMHPDGSMAMDSQQMAYEDFLVQQTEDLLIEDLDIDSCEPTGGPVYQSGSWAQVASSMGNGQGRAKEPMDLLTPLSVSSGSRHYQNSNDGKGDGPTVMGFSGATLPSEIPEAKAGVLRIHGKVTKDPIRYFTSRIHEGPLFDIRIETNERTRVTFQHAVHALAFLKSNQNMENMIGHGRLGEEFRVELAEIVDWNDDHLRMNQPIRERRRLSFARKRLFADNMTSDKWEQDIRSLVGTNNIDFTWVFNSGNATAVFTSTLAARRVFNAFHKWQNTRAVYSGVSVTYSSDPCEKELVTVNNAAQNFGKRAIR